ncbi:MAG: hypothetical protein GX383_10705 [Clostridium sp.]|jgi:hypothetical protein|nr:hypothetical protein [Clostridium sp.]
MKKVDDWVDIHSQQIAIFDSFLTELKAPYISSKVDYDGYYAQEVESDARGFAALSSPED